MTPTGSPTPTTSPTPSPASHYVRFERECIVGFNLPPLYHGKSVDECELLCDEYGTGCRGFEYGVDYGGTQRAGAGHCYLQSTSEGIGVGCTSPENNLDFHMKVDGSAPPTLAPTSSSPTMAPTTLAPTRPLTTSAPTPVPTTPTPTIDPTVAPRTSSPTTPLTEGPSASPSTQPTIAPSINPTKNPTKAPTGNPTASAPSTQPTIAPSINPTKNPTKAPTGNPTGSPITDPCLAAVCVRDCAGPACGWNGDYDRCETGGFTSTLERNSGAGCITSAPITSGPTAVPTVVPAEANLVSTGGSDDGDASSVAVAVGSALGTAAVAGMLYALHVRRSRASRTAGNPVLPPPNRGGLGGLAAEPLYNTIDEDAVGRPESIYAVAVVHNPAYGSTGPGGQYATVEFPEPAYAGLETDKHKTYDTQVNSEA